MRWIDGLLTIGLAICLLDGMEHAAESGGKADREEQQHHPRLGAELAVEPQAEQDSDQHRHPELEPYRARRQRAIEALAFLGWSRRGLRRHGLLMRVVHP